MDAYIAWVVGNANVAWRNIVTIPSATAASTTTLNISNIGTQSQNYFFLAECSNIPANTTVTMSCAAEGPSPAIEVQMVSSTPSFGLATPVTSLPAPWGPTPLVVTLQAAPGQVLDSASVVIRQMLLGGAGRSQVVQRLMRPLHQHSRHPILNQDSRVQQMTAARCGEFSIYFQTAGFRVPLRSIDW